MLVNATSSPAPALWQGLMLIGILVWGVWINKASSKTGMRSANVFLGTYAAATSVLVYFVFI